MPGVKWRGVNSRNAKWRGVNLRSAKLRGAGELAIRHDRAPHTGMRHREAAADEPQQSGAHHPPITVNRYAHEAQHRGSRGLDIVVQNFLGLAPREKHTRANDFGGVVGRDSNEIGRRGGERNNDPESEEHDGGAGHQRNLLKLTQIKIPRRRQTQAVPATRSRIPRRRRERCAAGTSAGTSVAPARARWPQCYDFFESGNQSSEGANL